MQEINENDIIKTKKELIKLYLLLKQRKKENVKYILKIIKLLFSIYRLIIFQKNKILKNQTY